MGKKKVWRSCGSSSQNDGVFETLDLIFPHGKHDGPMQMALDEVLLGSVARPTLRIYNWSAPSVTFGYFQKIEEVRKTYPDLPPVRRWTGGGMVEHGEDLTFSLMIPRTEYAASISPALFYKELHGGIAAWLSEELGSEVRLAGQAEIRSGTSCFIAPACDDLLLGGKKILGGAQRRSAGALLYQGSLQGARRWECVETAFSEPEGVPEMAFALGRAVKFMEVSPHLLGEAEKLAEIRYRSRKWLERR
jgi:lipoate-protein ligase A